MSDSSFVRPMNLQHELQDHVEAAGAPGMVLTSQGPGLAPIWMPVESLPTTGRGYAFQQVVAADHWEVEHNFLWNPTVNVTADDGSDVLCAISHPRRGTTYLDFNWSVAGIAWLT